MSKHTCLNCGTEKALQLSGGAPYVSLATSQPLRLICRPCARELELQVEDDGGQERIRYNGDWFLELGGAFLHSDSPRASYIYKRLG